MTSLIATAQPAALTRPIVHAGFIEFVATAFLLIAVVGSGIMAERLAGGNVGLAKGGRYYGATGRIHDLQWRQVFARLHASLIAIG